MSGCHKTGEAYSQIRIMYESNFVVSRKKTYIVANKSDKPKLVIINKTRIQIIAVVFGNVLPHWVSRTRERESSYLFGIKNTRTVSAMIRTLVSHNCRSTRSSPWRERDPITRIGESITAYTCDCLDESSVRVLALVTLLSLVLLVVVVDCCQFSPSHCWYALVK